MHNCSRRCWPTHCSFTTGFINKLKPRLPPFSLIHIRCRRVFCFRFRSLLWVNSDIIQLLILYADKLGILGCSKFHVWDRVLCQLIRKYCWSVSQYMRFLASLIWRPIFFQIYTVRFQINHFHFFEKYANFIHRQGATGYKAHGSDFRGTSITVAL